MVRRNLFRLQEATHQDVQLQRDQITTNRAWGSQSSTEIRLWQAIAHHHAKRSPKALFIVMPKEGWCVWPCPSKPPRYKSFRTWCSKSKAFRDLFEWQAISSWNIATCCCCRCSWCPLHFPKGVSVSTKTSLVMSCPLWAMFNVHNSLSHIQLVSQLVGHWKVQRWSWGLFTNNSTQSTIIKSPCLPINTWVYSFVNKVVDMPLGYTPGGLNGIQRLTPTPFLAIVIRFIMVQQGSDSPDLKPPTL